MREEFSDKRRQTTILARTLLEKAGLSSGPFTAEELASRSYRFLGQPVLLMPFDCPPKGDGAVFNVAGRYVICFRANTDELHRRHIIMHELAHVVLGHHTELAYGWTTYDRSVETEADLLADVLVEQSLGIDRHSRPFFERWMKRLVGRAATDQQQLRSLFE